jgi:hypothetical protein
MKASEDPIITLKIHQSQLDSLYTLFSHSFLERTVRQMVDLLYRTVRVPFRTHDDQLVIIILDQRRQGIIAAFHVKIQSGGSLQSLETIPLDLTLNGHKFGDLFKAPASPFPQAAELTQSLLDAHFGNLWTVLILDFNQISKLISLLNFEPTKESIGKIARRFLDRVKDEKIKLLPIPDIIDALEKLF